MIAVQETREVFRFDELSDAAKDAARQWFDEMMEPEELSDAVWGYDFADADMEYGFPAEMKRAGITLHTRAVPLMGGSKRYEPEILWSLGFGQSDGVWFSGSVDIADYLRFRKLAGKYRSLYNRADDYSGSISGRERRGISVSVDGWSDSDSADSQAAMLENDLDEYVRDLASRMYWQLRAEHEYQLSDETLAETCSANEYGFLESGEFYGHAPDLYAE